MWRVRGLVRFGYTADAALAALVSTFGPAALRVGDLDRAQDALDDLVTRVRRRGWRVPLGLELPRSVAPNRAQARRKARESVQLQMVARLEWVEHLTEHVPEPPPGLNGREAALLRAALVDNEMRRLAAKLDPLPKTPRPRGRPRRHPHPIEPLPESESTARLRAAGIPIRAPEPEPTLSAGAYQSHDPQDPCTIPVTLAGQEIEEAVLRFIAARAANRDPTR